MKKICFLLSLLWMAGGAEAMPVKGTVTSTADGKPVAGVLITDGYTFTKTDDKGAFAFEASDLARFLSMVTPSGWIAPYDDGFPRYYIAVDPKTKRYDFQLQPWAASAEGYDLLAVADPQPKTDEHFGRMQREVMPPLKRDIEAAAPGTVQAGIILGDICWDTPNVMLQPVKEEFGKLGIPFYPVIGNHDHDLNRYTDRDATEKYCEVFGPTYYAFDMGNTHFIVVDDIYYFGQKRYIEEIDEIQCAWIRNYIPHLPVGSRVCIAMHAPVWKSWRNEPGMQTARWIIEDLKDYEVHFLTGHTHVISNYDIGHAIEHNVAQISGNLWYDPINYDGAPKGYLRVHEEGDSFIWGYRVTGYDVVEGYDAGDLESFHIRVWNPGEVKGYRKQVVAKIWEWDPHWSVVWYEDGEFRGAMPRVKMADPDYQKYLDAFLADGGVPAKPQHAHPVNFYFTATPSAKAKVVRIVATDRFGRTYEAETTLGKSKK